ncbi:(d)CMP kinase [Legionella israelensis]|uniref:Cytidylate kinase n=1 Tax=Legionella israelensis TaxID=454 RepID=A0A0W0VR84_9GAMM|nr:(d)CMP kinase [Legionella israelensis]KTD22711.1 cytidylate kinase [Legionella israelensis]QBS08500.1 (d)CMP kinase [Legionella israelensis]SCY44264.1 cytidylate kinase [Legionella israelensis DSM 19235]STX58148.1 cytidylate kinase [Legionella israelensis]
MKNDKKASVITIDGPSGTGKGTVCYLLAKHLNWNILDSGVIYRVLAYAAAKNNISSNDVGKLVELAEKMDLQFQLKKDSQIVLLDGEDVSKQIRTEACGQQASAIAALPEVRKVLLQRQRSFAKSPGLVTDGRDMGTVVFPDAILKFFLYATEQERARRRYLQLKDRGNNVSLAEVVDELVKRDERDTSRIHSPLKPASDAIIIDTTELNITQVFNNVLKLVEERLNYSKL